MLLPDRLPKGSLDMTPDEMAKAALAAEFSGISEAKIYGSGLNIEPGQGRVRLGALKFNNGFKGKSLIIEADMIWFRGGTAMHETENAGTYNVPDSTLKPGDKIGHVRKMAWLGDIKQYCLEAYRAITLSRGGDPASVTEGAITPQAVADLIATQAQAGLEMGFTAIHSRRKDGGLWTNVTWDHAASSDPPREATASAGYTPPAWLASSPEPPPAALDPLAALMALKPEPTPKALDRDGKIAFIKNKDPRFATVDLTSAPDEAISAAFEALQ